MPIEIRELVIRATVDDAGNRSDNKKGADNKPDVKNSCDENVDMIIQLIKDKKER
jgi:hypothetical protein